VFEKKKECSQELTTFVLSVVGDIPIDSEVACGDFAGPVFEDARRVEFTRVCS
jgi:hypothetical protein